VGEVAQTCATGAETLIRTGRADWQRSGTWLCKSSLPGSSSNKTPSRSGDLFWCLVVKIGIVGGALEIDWKGRFNRYERKG
jgi:hypothetical protein